MKFKKMFDFECKRTFLEALAFYLIWSLLLVLVVFVLTMTWGIIYAIGSEINIIKLSPIDARYIAGKLSHYSTVLICLIVTFLVIYKKKIYDLRCILLFLITAFSCFYLNGALLGFVFTSILTMFSSKEQLKFER